MSRIRHHHRAARSRTRDRVGLLLAAGLSLALAAGCDAPVVQGAPPAPAPAGATPARPNAPATPGAPARPGAPATPSAAASAATDADAGTSGLVLGDNDFTENDRTRDPFRNFARDFVPTTVTETRVETTIRLREYALDDLRLVAVITGTDNPYAMVIDPHGAGTIIRRGEYVGRPDTVQSAAEGGMPHQVPWRVARIIATRVRRDHENNLAEDPGEVVFEREDRLNPNAERVEHSITLDPAAAANRPTDGPEPVGPALPTLPGAAGAGGSLPYLPPTPGGANGRPVATSTAGPPGTQSYTTTTIIPPQPAQPAPPTTVVIQTTPQGQVSVGQPGAGSNNAPAAQRPRDPYGPPPGGTDRPPAVEVHGSPPLTGAMPSSGLSP